MVDGEWCMDDVNLFFFSFLHVNNNKEEERKKEKKMHIPHLLCNTNKVSKHSW